jgi:molybdopterin converting factor small subunit
MPRKIKLAQVFKQYTSNREIVEVEGSTVRECLNSLIKKYPDIKKWIYDSKMSLLVVIILNGDIVLADKLDKPVSESEMINLIPIIAGG